jgi:mono/diheme cytochrome c family protein
MRILGSLKIACLVTLGFASLSLVAISQSPATDDPAASLYKLNCITCHGDDGAGSALGARLNVKDLRSKEVQDKTSAELEQAIRNGSDKMPAFKSRLNDDQVQKLVEYIRQKKTKAP